MPVHREGQQTPVLVVHPDYEDRMFVMPEKDDITTSTILAGVRRVDRPQRDLLTEWARLNVLHIDDLFTKCRTDDKFSRDYRKFYEPLRAISSRMLGFSLRIQSCEEFIQRRNEITLETHKAHLERLKQELKTHETLVQEFEDDLNAGPTVDRTRARKKVIKFRYTPLHPDPTGIAQATAMEDAEDPPRDPNPPRRRNRDQVSPPPQGRHVRLRQRSPSPPPPPAQLHRRGSHSHVRERLHSEPEVTHRLAPIQHHRDVPMQVGYPAPGSSVRSDDTDYYSLQVENDERL